MKPRITTSGARPATAWMFTLAFGPALLTGCVAGTARTPPTAATASLEGLVTNSSGGPIEGAQVFIADQTAGTLTDEGGGYRLELEAFRRYVVKAVRVGFTRDSLTVSVGGSGSVTRVDFVLADAPPCEEQCFDSRGNPIACC